MGVFKKFIDSLYEEEPEPKEHSALDKFYKEPSTPKKDRASFVSRLADSLYEDPSAPKKDRPSFMSRLIDSLFEDTSGISFTDSDDIASTSEGVIGEIRRYKKMLDMLSIGVNIINKDDFPRANEVVTGYLRLALKFKQELEPYINQNANNLSASTSLKIQRSLGEFGRDFQNRIPEVKTLIWLTQMTGINETIKSIFDSGTLSDMTTSNIQKYYDYVNAIASQKTTFVGYKSELINELLTSEYRLTMISLMRKIGSGEKVSRSPFAGVDPKKIAEFEKLFMDDYYSSGEQYKLIMDLKRKYIATGKFSQSEFDELTACVDSFDEKLSMFMVNDYSVSEIFSDDLDYFNDLKLFIKIKLAMNTMNFKYRRATEQER